MFDDQPNVNQPAPPTNLPTEPEDMFEGVDKSSASFSAPQESATPPNALNAGLLKPKATVSGATRPASSAQMNMAAAQPQTMPQYTMREPVLGKIILFVVFGGLFAGLVYGGWWAYNKYLKTPTTGYEPTTTGVPETNLLVAPETTTVPEQENSVTNVQEQPASTTEAASQMKSDQILFGEAIDTDKDGLDDVREKQLGTDVNKSDTDNDGLSDGDEVIIWKTNPLNPDSDGDGYLDGKEVKNGYNPLGPGKLNLVPVQATTTAQIVTTTQNVTTSIKNTKK